MTHQLTQHRAATPTLVHPSSLRCDAINVLQLQLLIAFGLLDAMPGVKHDEEEDRQAPEIIAISSANKRQLACHYGTTYGITLCEKLRSTNKQLDQFNATFRTQNCQTILVLLNCRVAASTPFSLTAVTVPGGSAAVAALANRRSLP